MALMTKIYWVGGLILLIVTLSLLSCHEYKRNTIVKTQLKEATANVVAANKSLERRSTISDKTEDIVTSAVVKAQELTIKASNLRDKIDETKKGVDNGSVDNAIADATYISSMWDAYCEAKPSSDRCATRQSTARLSSK